MNNVHFIGETGINGAEGDYTDDAQADNDSPLVQSVSVSQSELICGEWIYIDIHVCYRCSDKKAGKEEIEDEGGRPKRCNIL